MAELTSISRNEVDVPKFMRNCPFLEPPKHRGSKPANNLAEVGRSVYIASWNRRINQKQKPRFLFTWIMVALRNRHSDGTAMIQGVPAHWTTLSEWQGHRTAMNWWRVATVAVVIVGLWATAAHAGSNTVCTGSLGEVTVEGDLDVPTGADCSLAGTTVAGNVTVEGGLVARTVYIREDLRADHAKYLGLYGHSTVGGNVIADYTSSSPPASPPVGALKANFLCYIWIGGDVQIQGSSSASPWLIGDPSGCSQAVQIAGNLEFRNNAGSISVPGHPKASGLISQNYIGGNLDCHNDTPPASGIPLSNTVNGEKLGECAGLGIASVKPQS